MGRRVMAVLRGEPILPLVARLRSQPLDRALADGSAPTTSRAYQARAAQLLGRRCRERLARNLERLVADAEGRRPAWSAAIPVQRAEIRTARLGLLQLAHRLRSAQPVDVRGVAIVAALLVDGDSPVYAPSEPGKLARLAHLAFDALGPAGGASENPGEARRELGHGSLPFVRAVGARR